MIIYNCEQATEEWFNLRLGKVTGTTLKDVMGSNNLSLIDTLIAEIMTEQYELDDYVSPQMQRGIDLEPLAIQAYENATGIETTQVGFIQSEKFERFGMSPDRLVGSVGGVEVKCPSSKKHIQYIRQNQVPSEYKHQVLSGLFINDQAEWWDFVSFDPRVSQKPLFIFRTYRNDVADQLKVIDDELIKFFAKLEKYRVQVMFSESLNLKAA